MQAGRHPPQQRNSALTDLGERGLDCPLLVISDGAPGLIGAVERTMGAALRQRCLIHRARNVLAKVAKNTAAEVKADYWAIFDVPDTIEPGCDAVTFVQQRIDVFAHRWRDSYPAAVRCLLDDRDSLTVYLPSPASTGRAPATPTSSNAPSARPAAA
jgi:putative transposase